MIATWLLAATTCIVCHSDPELWDESERAKVKTFEEDVHASIGLSCHDCHGGNAGAKEDEAAMDASYKPNPFRGAPSKKEIPTFCGRCHSDAAYMKKYRPDMRVDQEKEYVTSHHGEALAKGDTSVATCIDCHGVHGILRAGDSRSPIYPTRVADTCGRCHGDEKKMAPYKLPHDAPEKWKTSVHANALLVREDLSAPTCNDCHGNHGAAPPGVASIAFVCGTCHGRESDLFRASPKADAFDEGAACIECHSNHAVMRPTITMLGVLPETPCAICHEGAILDTVEIREHYESERDALLAQMKDLPPEERFDEMLQTALGLPFHSTSEDTLRPEFERLYSKFRIGSTSSGGIRCSECHEDDEGSAVAAEIMKRMLEVTSTTAIAERTLLAAHRGGVEVRPALPLVDDAVAAQIELEVLVHSFYVGTDGELSQTHTRGMTSARSAVAAGEKALGELSYRRSGLLVSIAFIALVLGSLAAKIRKLPA